MSAPSAPSATSLMSDVPGARAHFTRHARWTLKERREARGLSKLELAAAARVGLTTVHDIEVGERIPTIDTCGRLASALGVRVDEIAWPSRETVRGGAWRRPGVAHPPALPPPPATAAPEATEATADGDPGY